MKHKGWGSVPLTKQIILKSNLIHSNKKAVDIVSRGAGVQCLFVLLDLLLNKISQPLNLGKNWMLRAGKMLYEPGKDVVHLWKEGTEQTAALLLRDQHQHVAAIIPKFFFQDNLF